MDLAAGIRIAPIRHLAFGPREPEADSEPVSLLLCADGAEPEPLVRHRRRVHVERVGRGGLAPRHGVEDRKRTVVREERGEQRRRQTILADAHREVARPVVGPSADGDVGQVIEPTVDHPRREPLHLRPREMSVQRQRDGREEPAGPVPHHPHRSCDAQLVSRKGPAIFALEPDAGVRQGAAANPGVALLLEGVVSGGERRNTGAIP